MDTPGKLSVLRISLFIWWHWADAGTGWPRINSSAAPILRIFLWRRYNVIGGGDSRPPLSSRVTACKSPVRQFLAWGDGKADEGAIKGISIRPWVCRRFSWDTACGCSACLVEIRFWYPPVVWGFCWPVGAEMGASHPSGDLSGNWPLTELSR